MHSHSHSATNTHNPDIVDPRHLHTQTDKDPQKMVGGQALGGWWVDGMGWMGQAGSLVGGWDGRIMGQAWGGWWVDGMGWGATTNYLPKLLLKLLLNRHTFRLITLINHGTAAP
jgi:hypothetical protein